MAAAGDADPETGEDPEAEADQAPAKLASEYDLPRGHIGVIYEDVFKDLYVAPPVQEEVVEDDPEAAEAEVASKDGSKDGGDVKAPRPWEEIDLSAEDEEIEAINAQLEGHHNRIHTAADYLQEKWDHAGQLLREHTNEKALQGLVVREQIPVPDSHLKNVLHHATLEEENLAIPRHMMEDVERHIAIKIGQVAEHDNLLAVSKPDAPNYLNDTASNMNRMMQRNVQPHLTDAQRTLITTDINERKRQRPPMPKTLNADERTRNLALIKKMQTKVNFLKNPRFTADINSAQRGVRCPFDIEPECVTFRNYDVGGVYEIPVVLKNVTKIGRHVRVVPCKNAVFSTTTISFNGVNVTAGGPSSIVAPGMSCTFCVRFAPDTLNDQIDQLLIRSELGDYALPIQSRRIQPELEIVEPEQDDDDDSINIGRVLAGEYATKTVTAWNHGGEGSFRVIPGQEFDPDDESAEHRYETSEETGLTTFISDKFRITPATFYLEPHTSTEVSINFRSTATGQFTYDLRVEVDNGEKVPLKLLAISDAVRLELLSWPKLPKALTSSRLESHVSPWSLVPWQLSWQQPGVQVGCSEAQTFDIANGGYMPANVEWRFVQPPQALLSHIAIGGKQRLSDDIMREMHSWPSYDPEQQGGESCPFTVSPAVATLAPFSSQAFTFTFNAYQPLSHCATVFAYLAATDLPNDRDCLLHYGQLQHLQDTLQETGFKQGLPLFGGAVSTLVDADARSGEAQAPVEFGSRLSCSCAVMAVCLSGRSIAPKVSCLPPLVALSGDVLPYVTHEREVLLRNTGTMPANFRFRLTSQSADLQGPLWTVAAHEVPPRPKASQEESGSISECAERLAAQWPPLPPFGDARTQFPGFGALATVAVEPHCGIIAPGSFVKIAVSLRIARESDIDATLLVDLPASLDDDAACAMPPIKVRVLAAVRAPRVEVRGTSFLDYGVVRAHARHTLKLRLDNPSSMPTMVRLRHRPGEKDEVLSSVALTPSYEPEDQPTARSALGDAPKSLDPKGGVKASDVSPEKLGTFPVASHEDVVNIFVDAVRGGTVQSFLPMRDMQEASVDQWVHARSGCFDKSGRTKPQLMDGDVPEAIPENPFLGVADDVDFIFKPECIALWPNQSAEVEVTLRTGFVGKYDALVEVVGFDSGYSQCIGAEAEVQLPKLRVSTPHAHFDTTYLNVASPVFELELFNDYDMPAHYNWNIPVSPGCMEIMITPASGVVPPCSSTRLELVVVPASVAAYASLLCQVFVQDAVQPLPLQVSARVYGPEVDYAVVPTGAEAPVITHVPRLPEDGPCDTYPIFCGAAPDDIPIFHFGEMELMKTKTMQLVLYNRTGIETQFAINVGRYPAGDPPTKPKKIGGPPARSASETMKPDDALMQTFKTEPQPVPSLEPDGIDKGGTKKVTNSLAKSREGSKSKFDPASRKKTSKTKGPRWLLDDKHEIQAFRTDGGAELALQKELKEYGMAALQEGRGYAVTVEPKSDWLEPFGKTTITCTCYSDVPGLMEDDLLVTIGQLQCYAQGGDYRIPMRANSNGNPLYVPDQQVGLNNRLLVPRLLIETITPAAKSTTRTFKVGNNSMTKVHLSWKIISQLQVQAIEDWRVAKAAAKDPVIEEVIEEVEPLPEKAAWQIAEEEGRELTEEEAEQKAVDEAAAAEAAEAAAVAAAAAEAEAPEPAAADAGAEGVAGEGAEEGSGEAPEEKAAWRLAEEEGRELTEEEAAQKASDEAAAAEAAEAAAAAAEVAAAAAVEAEAAAAAEKLAEMEEAWRVPPQVQDPFALQNGDPPLQIEPQEAILPVQGTATFTVTMLASKATTTSEGHYKYRLIGEGRYTEDKWVAPSDEAATVGAAVGQIDGAEMTKIPVGAPKTYAQGVSRLPEIVLDNADLHSDDSDLEEVPAEQDKSKQLEEGENSEKVQDIISTLTIDCVGDCIIPRLIVDKKGDPSTFEFADGDDRKAPVFKFVHSSLDMALVGSGDKQRTAAGVKLCGLAGGTPHQGISSSLVREVTMANENICIVFCRFRAEGPFRINMAEQAGKKPVVPLEKPSKKHRPKEGETVPEDPMRQLFAVPPRSTITLLVEFVPSMVKKGQWTHNIENVFRGDVVVEYPRDESIPDADIDLQRVHLMSTSRKPSIRLNLVPITTLDPLVQNPRADLPPWAETPPLLIEFGYAHIEGVIARTRVILLLNETNVISRWRVFHVGRKRRPPHEMGVTAREDEDFRALDDREAFSFDVSEGELHGPSKDGLVSGSDVRMPKWCPTTPALPARHQHGDEWRFEPRKVIITFKPKRNEVYKCKFRVQVEEGKNIDFICRGCGSYDEEDDAMDYQEA